MKRGLNGMTSSPATTDRPFALGRRPRVILLSTGQRHHFLDEIRRIC